MKPPHIVQALDGPVHVLSLCHVWWPHVRPEGVQRCRGATTSIEVHYGTGCTVRCGFHPQALNTGTFDTEPW